MKTCRITLCLLFCLSLLSASAQDDLDNYIARLRQSEKTGGKETAFMSPGADFLYGQGYFDTKSWDMAAMYFKGCVEKEPENPFFNYQYAVSLINQKDKYKSQQAQPFLEKAFQLNPSLKTRFQQTNGAPANPKPASQPGGLTGYIERLKYARSTGGKETEMNSVGRDVMYGYDYYERGEYGSAATSFRMAQSRDTENPYINYLLGVSLHAQGQAAEAQKYLAKAYAGDASLKQQFAKDGPKAVQQHKTYVKKQQPPVTPPAPRAAVGGKLVFGSYTCHQTIWNGPNTTPAYRNDYKGYFVLNANGTYRWLDDGATGKYSYDAKTGTIKWLSGKFAGEAPRSTIFQPGGTYATITVNFSADYRWECGCKK